MYFLRGKAATSIYLCIAGLFKMLLQLVTGSSNECFYGNSLMYTILWLQWHTVDWHCELM